MRTTLNLDDDIYEIAAQQARASGETLGRVLSNLARRGLKPVEFRYSDKGRRFPVFPVSPDAELISVEAVERYLDDEGIV